MSRYVLYLCVGPDRVSFWRKANVAPSELSSRRRPWRLELPALPVHLYRYRSLKSGDASLIKEIESIKQGYLYCSPIQKMNDPWRASPGQLPSKASMRGFSQICRAKLDLGLASFTKRTLASSCGHITPIIIPVSVSATSESAHSRTHENVVSFAYLLMTGLLESVQGCHEPGRQENSVSQEGQLGYERMEVLGDCGRVEYRKQCVSRIYLGSRIATEHQRTLVQASRLRQILQDGSGRIWP
jgi:hypothetical protein